jgi:hypothetical protein
MRTNVPEKLLKIADDISEQGNVNLTRVVALKKGRWPRNSSEKTCIRSPAPRSRTQKARPTLSQAASPVARVSTNTRPAFESARVKRSPRRTARIARISTKACGSARFRRVPRPVENP